MPSTLLADLIGPDQLAELATPSTLRLGQEIAEQGGVDLEVSKPLHVEAKITGGQRRTVSLRVEDDELTWDCTCMSEREQLCKHAVAAAIATWE